MPEDNHLEHLVKLLTEIYNLVPGTVSIRFDAEGRMYVDGKINGVVHAVTIKGELVDE